MSEVTIRPADGWKAVTAAGHEIMVTGESAVGLDVLYAGSSLVVSSSWHTDGERWTRYIDVVSGGPEVIVRAGRGYVIKARRR